MNDICFYLDCIFIRQLIFAEYDKRGIMKPSTSFLSSQQKMAIRKTPTEDLDCIDIALIGGYNNEPLKSVEVIRITEGVITESPKKLPQLPFGLSSLSGVAMSDKREIIICSL